MTARALDASSVQCLVFTRRQGLASRLGHDLKLRVGQLSGQLDPDARSLSLVFRADSLTVVEAMRDGRPMPAVLSDRDLRQIHKDLHSQILDVRHHPDIRFSLSSAGTGQAFSAQGTLELRGHSAAVAVDVTQDPRGWHGKTRFAQSAFGIKPFTALLGALTVADQIEVTLDIKP